VSLRDILTGRQPLVELLRGNPARDLDTKAAWDVIPMGVQGRPQYPSTDIEALQRAYTRSEIVYAAIQAKAKACVDPRLLVEQRARAGEWEEIPGHPFRRLMMKPNRDMDEAQLTQSALVSSDIAGVWYAEIERGKNRLPIGLHPLNPAKMSTILRTDGQADYQFKDGTTKVIIKGEDMVVWRKPSPLNRWDNLSPLAVALGSVDADAAQTDFTRAFFNNAGVPSGVLKVLNRTLSQAQADELTAKWRLKFGRQWGNQQNVAVLDENAEYQKIGANLGELQGDSLREFTETRVAMVFGVPVLIIYAFAGLRRATYSNLKEAYAGFWDTTLTPWFKEFRTFLQWRLLTEFVSEDLLFGERVRLNWDMSQVAALQEDVDAVQLRARENFQAGALTLNQFLAKIGEKADPAGDYYLRLFNRIPVPVGEVLTGTEVIDAAPTDEPSASTEAPKAAASALTPGQKKLLVRVQKAGRQTVEKRIERDLRKMLSAHYEAAARAVERAA
jgi:HK97 family phage portal protein